MYLVDPRISSDPHDVASKYEQNFLDVSSLSCQISAIVP